MHIFFSLSLMYVIKYRANKGVVVVVVVVVVALVSLVFLS